METSSKTSPMSLELGKRSPRNLRGLRYLREGDRIHQALKEFVLERLPFLDFNQTCDWYARYVPRLDDQGLAFLGCNDRYFLLTGVLRRKDALHPWLFDRVREVEADPDGVIDLWSRFHYKDLCENTQILTTKGWKRHGDLIPGDWVFSPSGKPVQVVATKHFTDSACYRVCFDGEAEVICGAGHLWKVDVASHQRVPGSWKGCEAGSKRFGRKSYIVKTSELTATWSVCRPAIQVTAPLQLKPSNLPIDPCVLGIWRNAIRKLCHHKIRGWKVVNAEPVETVPTNCIQVDAKDGMYLCGEELIPTHNSTIITFAGGIQEIVCDPEITIVIFSAVRPIAQEFLAQIKEELENNDTLKRIYSDVLYQDPKRVDAVDGRPHKWGVARGFTVKRKANPKEATVEAHGLLDSQPTSRHFRLHIYDDMVTQDHLSEDQIKKTTDRWELADNLGHHLGVRKWAAGTRYHFADTYSEILRRKALRKREYPATDDGKLTGKPVFLSAARWAEIKTAQRSTVSAQMLLNPIAGNEATFKPEWLKSYDVIPAILSVYITCDPSKGVTTKGNRPDRTAIAVVGVDQGGNRYLLDGVRHRMKLSDRWKWLKHFHDKWQYHPGVQMVKAGYEQYGMLDDLEVLREYMERENNYIDLQELGTPRKGPHAKPNRIERLEPDIRRGIFYFPAVVYYQDFAVESNGRALWRVWSERDDESYIEKFGKRAGYNVGEIIYRPLVGLTRRQRATSENRVVRAITRKDEHGGVYDLTRAFIEEYIPHPFGQHDDLLDAMARFYDLEPLAPRIFERSALESLDSDSGTGHESYEVDQEAML